MYSAPLNRAPCGGTAETKDGAALSPPAAGYPSMAGREEEDVFDPALCASLLLETCLKAAGAQEPGAQTSLGRVKGEGKAAAGGGSSKCGRSATSRLPRGNSMKGARGSSFHGPRPREGLLTLPQELQEPQNGFKRGSPWRPLERKLDNRRGQPGGRWSIAWVVAQELIKQDFFKPPSVEAASWKCRKRALGKHIGEQQTPAQRTKAPRSAPASRSPGPGAPPGGGADNKAGSLQARKVAPPRARTRGLGAGTFVGEQPGSLGIPVK